MKILLAVDQSDAALAMIDAVLGRRGWFRDAPEFHLAYVHPPIPLGFATRHVSEELVERYYREETASVLGPAQARLIASGETCLVHGLVGDPAEALVHLARAQGIDLLCVAPHGRSAVANAVLGSVATKLARISPVPVMFVR